MNPTCELSEWECVLLNILDGGDCFTHRRADAKDRERNKEEARRAAERQALIFKYDNALKMLDKNPMTVVESTYRGLLGEFIREWESI